MKTNFGFKEVEKDTKQSMVNNVFTSVADKYDIMNDVMSFGIHRLWKEQFVDLMRPKENKYLLDLAGGTGDIAFRFLNKGGHKAYICDINYDMMINGRKKSIDKNIINNFSQLDFICANAEQLPCKDRSFPLISIAFGIRNVTNINNVLTEAHRILQPGGKFTCLEFSNVDNEILNKFYSFYSFNIIPKLGKLIANDRESYQYLVESIKKFPTAMNFKKMFDDAGFINTSVKKLSGGIVAIHTGWKV